MEAGDGLQSVELGDVNGDGRLDVVAAGVFGDGVVLLLQDDAGGFVRTAVEGAPNGPLAEFPNGPDGGSIGGSRRVTLGDLNDDGRLDIVVTDTIPNSFGNLAESFNSLTVLLQDDAGGFVRTDVLDGVGFLGVALADIDGPARLTPAGLPDLGPLVPTPADPLILA